jgi:rare lipoprotein A
MAGVLVMRSQHRSKFELHSQVQQCAAMVLPSLSVAMAASVVVGGGFTMTACAGSAYIDIQVDRVRVVRLWRGSAEQRRSIFRCFALVLAAASLAACAQTSVTRQTASRSVTRQAAVEPGSDVRSAPARRVSIVRRHDPFPSHKEATTGGVRPYGVASFYSEGSKTANGEAFDPRELTAAHRSLPFGTRLRVTNVATGQSVTVRVNDRGPFVAGRDVDVSHSAAEALGIVGDGVAKVRMDVVQ